jgi:hypothetical protein
MMRVGIGYMGTLQLGGEERLLFVLFPIGSVLTKYTGIAKSHSLSVPYGAVNGLF